MNSTHQGHSGGRKIQFKYPNDDVTIFRTHLRHHSELYLGFLVPSIARNQDRGTSDSELWNELEVRYSRWATGEVLCLGYVSVYHLWEKQALALLRRQASLHNVTMRDRKHGESVPDFVRGMLRAQFDIELDGELIVGLDRARRIVNAIKHGSGPAMSSLSTRYPELIARTTNDLLYETSSIVITEGEFQSLVSILDGFWERLPYDVCYT